MSLSRRSLLSAAAVSLAFVGFARAEGAPETYLNEIEGYGPLKADPNGIFDLPEGFSYRVVSFAGETMDDGYVVPGRADGMARATLTRTFTELLTLEDVQALAPDILAAIKTRCPADTMFGNEIRMAGFRVLAKYHFKEAFEAGVEFAKTQGGHGSESRTGEIMKGIVSYGAAARGAIPGLKELIVALNDQCARGEFPKGELNNRRVSAVENAIKSIEAATTQPELRSISSGEPKI